jgi:hypothetical protein
MIDLKKRGQIQVSQLGFDSRSGNQIPQPAGWGSFIPAYKAESRRLPNPPTGRLGIVHSSLQGRVEGAPESPNRQVGDRSFLPTRQSRGGSRIPQPAGWGSFIPAYKTESRGLPNPPTGRLGIVHSSLRSPLTFLIDSIGLAGVISAGMNDPQPAGWGI